MSTTNNIGTTEADSIATLAQQAAEPEKLEPGTVYAVPGVDGQVRIVDTDEYDETPRFAKANRQVTSASSFVEYLERHCETTTEVYADAGSSSVVGIIDSHEFHQAGWQKHRVTLVLEHTPAWIAWTGIDGTLMEQTAFAEFIEQNARDVRVPESAEVLDLAQHFEATKSADFKSGERLANGQVSLRFEETIQAKAGQKGDIEIPSSIMLAVKPYLGGPTYKLEARFRYRIGSKLALGVVLIQPHAILESAFDDIVAEIRDGNAKTADDGAVTGHRGIEAPIFFGRP